MRRSAFSVLLFFQMLLSRLAFAGGPLNVAGVSGFQTELAGTPITWANGQVTYYTDQGDLSALLPSAAADQFVADAFARWTLYRPSLFEPTEQGRLRKTSMA